MANDTETTDISETWQRGDAVRRVGSAAARVQAQFDGFTLVEDGAKKTATPKKRAAKKAAGSSRTKAPNDQAPETEAVDSSAVKA